MTEQEKKSPEAEDDCNCKSQYTQAPKIYSLKKLSHHPLPVHTSSQRTILNSDICLNRQLSILSLITWITKTTLLKFNLKSFKTVEKMKYLSYPWRQVQVQADEKNRSF